MQTVLMLIQFGTLVFVALGAWLSLRAPRTDSDVQPPVKKDIKISMS